MLRISLLSSELKRDAFDCGEPHLNRYFHEQVGQDVRRRVTSCFVAQEEDGRIVGFYTLAAASVDLKDLPQSLCKRLPRYPSLPAARLGRLAIASQEQRKGLGGVLLADALQRILSMEIAVYALVVEAKDINAQGFYRHHGFQSFPETPLRLFLPMATLKTKSQAG